MSETIIPERGTKAFAEYAAGVEWEAQNGGKIECQWRPDKYPEKHHDWEDHTCLTVFCWADVNYRVAVPPPEPHPIDQWRAMSESEREGKVLETRLNDGGWAKSQLYGDGDIAPSSYALKHPEFYRIRELSLSERNAIVRKRWEAMEETERKGVRKDKDGKLWTWISYASDSDSEAIWPGNLTNIPLWADNLPYSLVPVPEPPKPRYVPWTRETCPVGAVVKYKEGNRYVILGAEEKQAFIALIGHKHYHSLIQDGWTMDDGSICGTSYEGGAQ